MRESTNDLIKEVEREKDERNDERATRRSGENIESIEINREKKQRKRKIRIAINRCQKWRVTEKLSVD